MSKKRFFIISYILLVFFVNNVFAESSELGYKEGELLVKFAPKSDGKQRALSEKNQFLSSINGGIVKHSFKRVSGLTLIQLPSDVNIKNALSEFKKKKDFLYVEPNYEIKAFDNFPNDSDFTEQWGLHNTGQTGGYIDADIDAPEGWDLATDSNIIVAVIDTGIDYTHPDLAANMWINLDEFPGDGVDNDDNGYIDDIYGYDFCTYGQQRDSNPIDDTYHGTHVAGIIGAVGNNNTGVVGVCWNIKIMNLKFLNYQGTGYTSDAVSCIEYAIDNGAKIINASWGDHNGSQSLLDAIEDADNAGVLFIAAAGNDWFHNNDSFPTYPASYECQNIISVLATSHYDWYSGFTNYGPTSVDLGAPGENIFSTFPIYETNDMNDWGLSTYYETISGTSMAAPFVAGACALVWSLNPSLTHMQVKDIILNSVDELGSLNGLCVTGGRLNLYKSLSNTPSRVDLSKVDNIQAGSRVVSGNTVTYTITYDYDNPGLSEDINNAVLIDYLPDEIANYNVNPSNGGIYDVNTHTVTWNLGTISHGDSNSFTLSVRVGYGYESYSTIDNLCKIISDSNIYAIAMEHTPLGHGGRVLNVNKGIWYDFIQTAINSASNGDTIQAGPGIYYEDIDISDKSIILRSTDPNNWIVVSNTIIYGSGGDEIPAINLYNTSVSNLNSQINGFTIRHGFDGLDLYSNYPDISLKIKNCIIGNNSGYYGGIYIYGFSPEITNCIIMDNYGVGICFEGISETQRTHPVISKTIIENNDYEGIYFYNCDPCIVSCIIRGNESYGINCYGLYDEYVIKNNFLYNNGEGGESPVAQAHLWTDQTVAIFRNNTLVSQTGVGIEVNSLNPIPKIINCIIWCATPLTDIGCNVTYSCIKDGYDGEGNIDDDPLFYDVNTNNFHIQQNSPCRDKGDANNIPTDETDIDGENRIIYGLVDIGADEILENPADLNFDGIVNFIDYAIFANDWLKATGFNESCDLDDNGQINAADLQIFCSEWLWEGSWISNWMIEMDNQQMMMQQGQGESMQMVVGDMEQVSVQKKSTVTEEDIKKVIDWFEWLWDEGILKERLSEEQFNELLKSLENSPVKDE
jgi:subtilisin family serine protease